MPAIALPLTPEELTNPPTCPTHKKAFNKLQGKDGKSAYWSCGEPGTNPDSQDWKEKYCGEGFKYTMSLKQKNGGKGFTPRNPLFEYFTLVESAFIRATEIVTSLPPSEKATPETRATHVKTIGKDLACEMVRIAKELLTD